MKLVSELISHPVKSGKLGIILDFHHAREFGGATFWWLLPPNIQICRALVHRLKKHISRLNDSVIYSLLDFCNQSMDHNLAIPNFSR